MQRKLLLIVLNFLGIWFYSQKVLNTPSQPGTIIDPVSISLQPGFSFSSTSGVFVAKIGSPVSVTPSTGTGTTYTPISVNYNSSFNSNENYIYTREYLVPRTTSDPSAPQIQAIQFFDGLGRPKQNVSIKSTPSGKDLVTHIPYDGFGRQVDSFLPVPLDSKSGDIHTGVESSATSYYGANDINDRFPFVHKELENSPLDRLISITQPGADWQSKPITYAYDANSKSDNVRVFSTTTSWSGGATYSSLNENGIFDDAKLYKNTTTDEDGNISIEFKNGQGQTLLVRKMLGSVSVDTYYVYNEYNQLAFVIPPKAAEQISIAPSTLDDFCYQYRYDGKNRLVEKKLPGKGWELMVYDLQDRLVATQDRELNKKGLWFFTKYDLFGRVAYTGITSSTNTRASEQKLADDAASNNAVRNDSGKGITASGITAYYDNGTSSYPSAITELLSVNYYDRYPSGVSIPKDVLGQAILSNISQATTSGASVSAKSLPVASFVRNIEKNSNNAFAWNSSYSFYDFKGRLVATHSNNYLGGSTKTESFLKFSGKPEYTIVSHKKDANTTTVSIREDFEYDHQERLVKHYQTIDNNAKELLAENLYNDLGQLKYKNIANGLQSLDYKYNIRGWMTQINNPENLGNKLFGLSLRYQNPKQSNGNISYNGNISEIDWATQNDAQVRRYNYKYDNLNRMYHAIYSKPNAAIPLTNAYNEWLQYDKNGNIEKLDRYGGMDSYTPMKIDELNYSYSGNKLSSVSDITRNNSGYPIGGNTIDYDSNGNMINHRDKGITSITYNHLNLPTSVILNSNNIQYTYRADGVKVKKISGNNTIDYLDGFHYENGTLQFFPTSEGYFDFTKKLYIYNYVDHLGNIRLSFSKNAIGGVSILDESNYYPFGLKHQGYNDTTASNPAYNYKYNGKELQETGMYDYGFRQYMPELGRWMQLDPLVEDTEDPYAYVYNNPISLKDPDGRAPDEGEGSCCKNLQGFVAAVVDNVTGVTNLVGKYNDGSPEYRSGVTSGNIASAIGGVFLTVDGGSNIAAGGTGLVASAVVSSTGVGTVVGGPGAAVSGGLIVKGTAEVAGGMYILNNVSKNMQNDKKFGGQNDTQSGSSREAYRKAKDQNGVPRSQQPDKVTTVKEKGTGNPLKESHYTNNKGEKVSIRKDNPRKYPDGGSQGNHYNAGKSEGKLKQHHNY